MIQLAMAIVNTARAITEVMPNPILVGLVSALGAAQILTIKSTPLPLAKGIIDIQGGTENKDSIPALLMPGETVLTKGITQNYYPQIVQMFKYPGGMGTISPVISVNYTGIEKRLDHLINVIEENPMVMAVFNGGDNVSVDIASQERFLENYNSLKERGYI